MKALITTACWGDAYIDALARYSAASLLSPGNLPAAAKRHSITWQLMAPRADLDAFLATDACRELQKYCTIQGVAFENEGIEIGQMPVGFDNNKYSFLSNLQNLAMRRAVGHDVLLFNYADCLWQDGSLPYAIDRIETGETDLILTLGIPVDDARGKVALEPFRQTGQPGNPLILPPRKTTDLIFDNLHSETQLRYWEGGRFTTTPTYLIWDVPGEGAIVRCVHQTIVAMRVQPDDPVYQAGIVEGSLDGNFSALAIAAWPYEVVSDTDKLTLFSLYDSESSSEKRDQLTREAALKLLMANIPIEQRALLLQPLLFKRRYDDLTLWQQRIDESEDTLHRTMEHRGTKFLGSAVFGEMFLLFVELRNRWLNRTRRPSSWTTRPQFGLGPITRLRRMVRAWIQSIRAAAGAALRPVKVTLKPVLVAARADARWIKRKMRPLVRQSRRAARIRLRYLRKILRTVPGFKPIFNAFKISYRTTKMAAHTVQKQRRDTIDQLSNGWRERSLAFTNTMVTYTRVRISPKTKSPGFWPSMKERVQTIVGILRHPFAFFRTSPPATLPRDHD